VGFLPEFAFPRFDVEVLVPRLVVDFPPPLDPLFASVRWTRTRRKGRHSRATEVGFISAATVIVTELNTSHGKS
jgi:hypothetical protein